MSQFFDNLWLTLSLVSYMDFGERIRCVLSEGMSLETFTLMWSHVNENKKMAKNPIFEISKVFEQLW